MKKTPSNYDKGFNHGVAATAIDVTKEILLTYLATVSLIAMPGIPVAIWRIQLSGINIAPDFDQIINQEILRLRESFAEYGHLYPKDGLDQIQQVLAHAKAISEGVAALLNNEDQGESLTEALLNYGSGYTLKKRQMITDLISQMQAAQPTAQRSDVEAEAIRAINKRHGNRAESRRLDRLHLAFKMIRAEPGQGHLSARELWTLYLDRLKRLSDQGNLSDDQKSELEYMQTTRNDKIADKAKKILDRKVETSLEYSGDHLLSTQG